MERHRSARAWLAIAAMLAIAAAACSAEPTATMSGSPRPSAFPSQGGLPLAELKYRLIDRFGVLWYCDPDEYPVAHGDEGQLAAERLPEIRRDAETYAAVTRRLGVDQQAELDAAQTLAVYRQWKMLNALVLELAEGRYRFDAIFAPALDAQEGMRVAGTIALDGTVEVHQRAASGPPSCPICLAAGTRIATPGGEVAVERLSVGALVLTVDQHGIATVATVARLGSAVVPSDHVVVRLILADGRSLSASPGHPLTDGRVMGSLRPGDRVDGSTVRSATRMRYGSTRTYDLLPSGDTGAYWANGVLLGSTLRP